ncbi:MAG: ABC transporter ATP-binding protein [Saprospiraceae bacterium]
MLKINQLTKIYSNGVKAMDDLTLSIDKGMFGLLGPNGAGKSTLMRTIATLQSPDSGSIQFGDIDVLKNPMQLRRVLGYLPQEFGVYPKVSALNLLDYFATLKGIASKKDRRLLIDEVLELTNLTDVRKKAVSSYSGGMKQRFGIAQMLLNRPQLIIVDEPTAGLDPAERQRFLNILREIGTENTVIFSTHIVADVRELCTDMAMMYGGRLLQHITPTAATQQLGGKVWTKSIKREHLKMAEEKYQVLSAHYNPDNSIQLRVFADGLPGANFSYADPDLEDVYFLALQGANENITEEVAI